MDKKFVKVVKVPSFDERAAYDPERPISGLIRTQLLHLHIHVPEKERPDVNVNDLHTEREASEYIATVMAKVHAQRRKKRTTRGKSAKLAKSASARAKKASSGSRSKSAKSGSKKKPS